MALGDYGSLGPESGFPIMVDPAITDAIDLAKEYQKELDYTPDVRRERVLEMLSDLNESWPLMQTEVLVSGKVRTGLFEICEDAEIIDGSSSVMAATIDDSDKERAQEVEFHNSDKLYASMGFCADVVEWPELIGGQEIGKRSVLRHYMTRDISIYNSSGELIKADDVVHTAALDDVFFVSSNISHQYAEAKVQEYFPDVIEDLESKLEHADKISERIMILGSRIYDIKPYMTGYERLALEMYLNQLTDIEYEDMPFVVSIKKGKKVPLFGIDTDDEVIGSLEPTEYFFLTTGLSLRPQTKLKLLKKSATIELYPNELELRLRGKIIGAVVSDDSVPGEIRIADMAKLVNLRDQLGSR